ncbi:MAG: epoxyqueuosine reductase QueH [Mycoplasmatota bacterium]
MNNVNYNLKMFEIINQLSSKKNLLLHVCCAPCSTVVVKQLLEYFNITIYFYNPNIDVLEEYNKRFNELLKIYDNLTIINEVYDNDNFLDYIKDYSHLDEGSNRCYLCYKKRLEQTAKYANEKNFEFFTTTLSISPYKNSKWINEIGYELEKKYKISYLCADFKKNNGYKKSIELSKENNLYRQDYCGCKYSKIEHENRIKENN